MVKDGRKIDFRPLKPVDSRCFFIPLFSLSKIVKKIEIFVVFSHFFEELEVTDCESLVY